MAQYGTINPKPGAMFTVNSAQLMTSASNAYSNLWSQGSATIGSAGTSVSHPFDWMTQQTYSDIANTFQSNLQAMAGRLIEEPRRERGSRITIEKGDAYWIEMPGGGRLTVNKDGSHEYKSGDGRVRYEACKIRAFNRYINSSDLIEEFIRFLGEFGVKQDEILQVPLQLFVYFLVYRAAEADGLDGSKERDALLYSSSKALPLEPKGGAKCKGCGQPLGHGLAASLGYCRLRCAEKKRENKDAEIVAA